MHVHMHVTPCANAAVWHDRAAVQYALPSFRTSCAKTEGAAGLRLAGREHSKTSLERHKTMLAPTQETQRATGFALNDTEALLYEQLHLGCPYSWQYRHMPEIH